MGYVFLALAIIGEVIATSFLKLTTGEKAVWWAYPIVGAGYIFAFAMLAQSLGRGVPLGIAYAIWAGSTKRRQPMKRASVAKNTTVTFEVSPSSKGNLGPSACCSAATRQRWRRMPKRANGSHTWANQAWSP